MIIRKKFGSILLFWLNLAALHLSCAFSTSSSYLRTSSFITRRNLATQGDFVDACVSYLLSDPVTGDGLISQNDFADFLLGFCQSEGLCSDTMTLEFWQLSVQLQLSFVFLICDDTTTFDEQVACLRGLQDMGGEFGYVLAPETADTVEAEIIEMCSSIYALAVDMGLVLGTAAPSPSAATPTAGVPTVVAPTAPSVPTPTAPSVPTPTAPSMPTPTAPSMPTPTAPSMPTPTAPSMPTPSAPSVPSMPTPTVASPSVSTPSMPTPTLPTIATPSVSPPSGAAPSVGAPSGTTPTVGGGAPSGATTPTADGGGSEPLLPRGSDSLGGGAIAGISIAGAVVVLAALLFVAGRRRRRRDDDRPRDKAMNVVPYEEHFGDESIMTEDSHVLKFVPSPNKDFVVDVQSLKGSSKNGSSKKSGSSSLGGGKLSETSSQKSYNADDPPSSAKGLLRGAPKSKQPDPAIKGMELVMGAAVGAAAGGKVHSIAQFDPDTPAGIALYRRGDEDDDDDLQPSRASSSAVRPAAGSQSSSFNERVKKLEAAISAGDWDEVAALADGLADKDDLSSLSGSVGELARKSLTSSARSSFRSTDNEASFKTPRTHLSSDDQARAATLDQLVEQGDWSAVASYATAYSRERKGESGSELEGGVAAAAAAAAAAGAASSNRSVSSGGSSQKRSFFDFVTGRTSGVSDAAAAAVGGDSEAGAEEAQGGAYDMRIIGMAGTNDTASSSEEAASPDKGHAVDSPAVQGTSGAEVAAVGAATGTGAAAVAAVAGGSKKKRWSKLFRRKAAQSKGKGVSPDRAADVAASSSEERPDENNPGSPVDLGLGRSVGTPSFDGSQLSSQSLRAQLDSAVARADWITVERLSAQIEAMNQNPHPGFSFASSADNEDRTISSATPSGGSSRILGDSTDDSGIMKSRLSSPSTDSEENVLGLVSPSTMLAKARSQPATDESVVSLRTELDLAVDRGDWSRVEELSAQILANSSPSSSRGGRNVVLGDVDVVSPGTPIRARPGSRQRAPSHSSSITSSSPRRDGTGSYASTPSALSASDKEKIAKVDQLVKSGDWKGVNVLAGLYEMESSGSLPPSSPQARSFDLEDATSPYIQSWLGASPPPDHWGSPTPDSPQIQRADSPAPSSSTASAIEAQTLEEFERLVNAKDWVGLAAFANADEDAEDEQVTERKLFADSALASFPTDEKRQDQGDLDKRRLKDTPPREKRAKKEESPPSPSRPRVLIPYWEEKAQAGKSTDDDRKPAAK